MQLYLVAPKPAAACEVIILPLYYNVADGTCEEVI